MIDRLLDACANSKWGKALDTFFYVLEEPDEHGHRYTRHELFLIRWGLSKCEYTKERR